MNSLTKSYDSFVFNYHMNDLDESLRELHGMLKTAERGINFKLEKAKLVFMIKATGGVTKKKSMRGVW